MTHMKSLSAGLALSAALGIGLTVVQAQNTPNLSFFITSAGSGNGANLGGIAGADAHCQKLASAVGAGSRTWRAYLSMPASGGQAAVNARDRIGKGPWQNAKGVVVAQSVADLHSDKNLLGKEGSLTEKGAVVNGRGDTPNTHDILTGSQLDGTAAAAGADYDLQRLHEQRRGQRADGPPRQAGWRRQPELVELGARVEGLQPGQSRGHRRRGSLLLLRRELTHVSIELLLKVIDGGFDRKAWHGPTLRGALRGVGAAQAAWRASSTDAQHLGAHGARGVLEVRRATAHHRREARELPARRQQLVRAPSTRCAARLR